MLPTFSLQRLPSLIHCLLTAGEGDWVFMSFTKCLAKALTNRCYQHLLEENGRGVEEGAKEKKDCGLVSRKRQPGLVWSLGRDSLASQHLLNLPLEFPSPCPGHCEEPPPWEHEREPLKRVYHFTLGQTVHYQCAQGFRALHTGPAESTCTMIHGEMRWTRPRLKCISEGANSQAPGTEVPQPRARRLAASLRQAQLGSRGPGRAPSSPGALVCSHSRRQMR